MIPRGIPAPRGEHTPAQAAGCFLTRIKNITNATRGGYSTITGSELPPSINNHTTTRVPNLTPPGFMPPRTVRKSQCHGYIIKRLGFENRSNATHRPGMKPTIPPPGTFPFTCIYDKPGTKKGIPGVSASPHGVETQRHRATATFLELEKCR